MKKEEEKAMQADLRIKWEAIRECYQLLAAGKARIVWRMIRGVPVYYTDPIEKKKAKEEQIEGKRQITVGDYRVQQASNRHVAIVYIPEGRLVFHAPTTEWLSEEKMKDMLKFYFEIAEREKNHENNSNLQQ